jgi:hypothetical protein
MEKVSKGQRVTITCQGLRVTGTVMSADHEFHYQNGQPPEVIGYLLEIQTDEGHYHYWKSLYDGGSITIHNEPELQVFEVRMHNWFDDEERFTWQSAKAQVYHCQSAEQADIFCQVLLDSDADVVEVRWNWRGSLQGHYVGKRS